MSPSHVPIARVQRLLRLLGEAYELSGDRDAMHRHLLRGLGRIVGAVAVMRVQVHDYVVGGGFDVRDGVDVGFDDDFRERVAAFYYHQAGTEPTVVRLIDRHAELERDGVVSIRRVDVLDDREWYESRFVSDVRRPARIDDSILTARRVGPERVDGVGLFRAWGDPPFTEEDREIVRLFDVEVLRRFPLPGVGVAAALPPALEGTWSRRERETLALLLTSASEKEIAARLGISRHTAHDYVKDVYRKLGVTSRAEVMSLAIRQR